MMTMNKPSSIYQNVTLLDPFAWIVCNLKLHLHKKANDLLHELQDVISWNVITGEISVLDEQEEGENYKVIQHSNIVDIIDHALDPGLLEPIGYKDIYRFLPEGYVKPITPPKPIKIKKKKKKKKIRETPPLPPTRPSSSSSSSKKKKSWNWLFLSDEE